MRRGEAYLGVYQGLVPFVQVGVTDRFSIGGGTPLIFEFDDWDRPYWITPKLQVYSGDGTHRRGRVFHAFAGDESVGVGYGVFTKERPGGAFTLGAGVGYAPTAPRRRRDGRRRGAGAPQHQVHHRELRWK